MTALRFIAAGKPVTTNHGYQHVLRGGRPGTKLTDDALAYKARIIGAARRAHALAGRPEPIERGAVVGVRFVFPTLGTDLDGPVKFVLDAVANGSRKHPGAGLIVNDTRVRRLFVEKLDSDEQPRTEVAITTEDDVGCPTCGCVCRRLFP